MAFALLRFAKGRGVSRRLAVSAPCVKCLPGRTRSSYRHIAPGGGEQRAYASRWVAVGAEQRRRCAVCAEQVGTTSADGTPVEYQNALNAVLLKQHMDAV